MAIIRVGSHHSRGAERDLLFTFARSQTSEGKGKDRYSIVQKEAKKFFALAFTISGYIIDRVQVSVRDEKNKRRSVHPST